MIDPKKINEIVQQIMSSLPPGLRNLPDEVQSNLRAALHSTFTKLDLVTREEFDTQMGVLQRTRAKLEDLEKKVHKLEKQERRD